MTCFPSSSFLMDDTMFCLVSSPCYQRNSSSIGTCTMRTGSHLKRHKTSAILENSPSRPWWPTSQISTGPLRWLRLLKVHVCASVQRLSRRSKPCPTGQCPCPHQGKHTGPCHYKTIQNLILGHTIDYFRPELLGSLPNFLLNLISSDQESAPVR